MAVSIKENSSGSQEKVDGYVCACAGETSKRETAAQRTNRELQFQLQQAENLPAGSEIDYATVQSPVSIQVGDAWDEIMSGTEIMIKDGRVHEIRQRT